MLTFYYDYSFIHRIYQYTSVHTIDKSLFLQLISHNPATPAVVRGSLVKFECKLNNMRKCLSMRIKNAKLYQTSTQPALSSFVVILILVFSYTHHETSLKYHDGTKVYACS